VDNNPLLGSPDDAQRPPCFSRSGSTPLDLDKGSFQDGSYTLRGVRTMLSSNQLLVLAVLTFLGFYVVWAVPY
jgi:hypothetical protein